LELEKVCHFKGREFQSGCSVDQLSFQAEEFATIERQDVSSIEPANQRRQRTSYWNIVESKRCGAGKVVQRQVLYLGEINDNQRQAWCRVIEAFDEKTQQRTERTL